MQHRAAHKTYFHDENVEKGRGLFLWVQSFFAFSGLCLAIVVFVMLSSSVAERVKVDRLRVSEEFFGQVVEKFGEIENVLNGVANVLRASGGGVSPHMLQPLTNAREENPLYRPFLQILWFYKTPEQGWVFTSFLQKSDKHFLKIDDKLLASLLDQGVMKVSGLHMIEGFETESMKEETNFPHVISTPFVLVKAIEVGQPEKGFLLAVVNPKEAFPKTWIKAHKNLAFLHVHDPDNGRTFYAMDQGLDTEKISRNPEEVSAEYKSEFSFANQTIHVSDVFVAGEMENILGLFPYTVSGSIVFFVLVIWLYLQYGRKTALDLAQKTFELQGEVVERERLLHTLKEIETENRSVMNAVRDVIFELDRDGRLIFMNAAWESLTGFEPEQSLQENFLSMLHPANQEELQQSFAALLKGSENSISHYTQIMTLDGTFKPVELLMSVVQREERKTARYIGMLKNIEERRRVEKALGEVEKKYKSIVEHAAGGIYQLTPEGMYLSANPAMARILGYENAEQLLREVKNSNEHIYVNQAQREIFYQTLEGKGLAYNCEFQMRKRDGTMIWVNENARAVKDDQGKMIFVEGSIEDITERKESDSAIRKAKIQSDMANRAKSEFIANMSHELRTPLNSIIGFSEIIKNAVLGPIGDKAYQDYAGEIYESGRRLLKVINEILDISKIEAGERHLNEGIVNMKHLVNGALEMLAPKIQSHNLVVALSLEGATDVVGEELALKQIVLNLLSNAVKFTPDGGRITVSAHIGKSGRFHFSVTDTGIGLDDEEIKKALSPFGQVDNALSRSGSGTGLGLTLVDALVKIHGGAFELFSQKGIGTTATMILPAERVVTGR